MPRKFRLSGRKNYERKRQAAKSQSSSTTAEIALLTIPLASSRKTHAPAAAPCAPNTRVRPLLHSANADTDDSARAFPLSLFYLCPYQPPLPLPASFQPSPLRVPLHAERRLPRRCLRALHRLRQRGDARSRQPKLGSGTM